MNGAAVTIRGLSKDYGYGTVLNDIDLHVEAGEFLTLLGPSGCGKSTLLRLIAGFESATAGSIEIGARRVDGLRPKERGLSMVFQNYALYPHMSVFDNIATPLVMRSLSFAKRFPLLGRLVRGSRAKRIEITRRVASVAQLLEIDGLLDRRPSQLSGGQRQRVALGRAIAPEPSVFLMDEPLSNLDARLRLQMRAELTELHRRLGITFIYVTHDQGEAMTMSQRVAVVMDGRIVQLGTPSEIYRVPAQLRVATFMGTHPINVCLSKVVGADSLEVLGQRVDFADAGRIATVAFRPEDARVDSAHDTRCITLEVTTERIEDHGSELLIHLAARCDGSSLRVAAPTTWRNKLAPHSEELLRLIVPLHALHFFDADGQRVEYTQGQRKQNTEAERASA